MVRGLSCLCLLLMLHGEIHVLRAQSPVSSGRLRIIVLEGQSAINLIPAAIAPVVEVRDENDFPVEGASVTFNLPASGASATFANQQRSQTVVTNTRGQAGAVGFSVQGQPTGQFKIRVIATHQGRQGVLDILQTNTNDPRDLEPPKRGFAKWKWWIIAGAAAGAAVGIVLGTRSSPPPQISVGTGPVVIGGPR